MEGRDISLGSQRSFGCSHWDTLGQEGMRCPHAQCKGIRI